MHVAIVCPYSMSRPGGVQEHVRGLGRALHALGHRVTVFAPEPSDLPHGVAAVSLGRAFGIPANGSVAPLGLDPRMLVRFDLGLDPADVIHIHEPFLPAGLGALYRAPDGVPVIGTFHAAADRFLPYAAARPLLRRAARRLAGATAVSPAAAALVRRYVPVEPRIVPNGVDAAGFAAAEPDRWARALGRVVLFVGRPETRKGFDVAVRAFVGAAASIDDVHLVCVGPESPPDILATGAAERVHCLGRVPPDRLRSLYRAADVLVAPSLGGESFGLIVLEGLAAGCAVLASDLPGYRFAGGDAAAYAPAGEVPGWREALRTLLTTETHREAMARLGPARAAAFDWARIAERTLDVYALAGVP